MKRKWFRRNWFKVLPLLLITAGFIWAVTILLAEDNWLAITALATLVLAFGVFLTIRQTREIQKSERRERLLNEIIEWATDLNKCAWELEYTISSGVSSEEYQIYRAAEVFSRWRTADAKSEYIRSIAPTFGEDLHSAVENVKKQLDKLLALKWKSLESKKDEEKKKPSEESRDTEGKLYEFVEALARVAAKYKTREVG